VLVAAFLGTSAVVVSTRGQTPFVRGDVDQSGRLEVTDAVRILRGLFSGEQGLLACEDAADVDDDSALGLTDAVFLLDGLFHGGPPPAAPYPACGEDPTADTLGCEDYEACRFAFTFLGLDFAADGVFFVVDRNMPGSGELLLIKYEMQRVVSEMLPEQQFGIVVFAQSVIRFPAAGPPANATDAAKKAGLRFVTDFSGELGDCPRDGLLSAVSLAAESTATRNVVIYVGDGTGVCDGSEESVYLQETLEAVTNANRGRARIHTIGMLIWSVNGEPFLRELAAENGGTYTSLDI
jgi:hypothetical protein